MQAVRFAKITQDAKSIPDGEVFIAYKPNQSWAFAMRINQTYTLSRFNDQRMDAQGIRNAKKQIMFCKTYGWSSTGTKEMNNDTFERNVIFMCLYCRKTTFDTSEPCVCRNKKIEDLIRKTPSGIVLPY